MKLNAFLRGVIVTLSKCGLKTSQIVARLHVQHRVDVSDRTIRNVMSEFRKRGMRPKQERRGRKRKCTLAQERTVVIAALRNRWLSLRALTEQVNNVLRFEGVHLSWESVRKILLKRGLRRRKAAIKPILTAAQRQKRLDFAREHSH